MHKPRFKIRNTKTKLSNMLIVALMGGGLLLLSYSMIIPAKAYLSVHLMNHAWQRTLEGQTDAKPWPWMDSRAIARIHFDKENQSFIVMQGTSGEVLAFAPGWHEQTARPGENGASVLSAHRDTHFKLLKDIEAGDHFKLQTPNGKWQHYEVSQRFITDKPQLSLPADQNESVIYLTTCYPFGDIGPRTTKRYIVTAVKTG